MKQPPLPELALPPEFSSLSVTSLVASLEESIEGPVSFIEMPFPVSEILKFGVSVSSDSIASVALNVPVDIGLKVMITVQMLFEASTLTVLLHGINPPFTFNE